jgi:antitoxin component YwqK of YwqJK toxin-antitoxin module
MDPKFIIYIDSSIPEFFILEIEGETCAVEGEIWLEEDLISTTCIVKKILNNDSDKFDYLLETTQNFYTAYDIAYNYALYYIFFIENYPKFEHTGIIRCHNKIHNNIEKSFFHINGKINGILYNYDSSGNVVEEITYVEGIMHGPHIKYYLGVDGLMYKWMECQYISGKYEGKYYENHPNKPIIERYYVNGNINGPCTFDNNKIIVKTEFYNGKEHGERTTYDKITGKLIDHCSYVNGKRNGEQNIYGKDFHIIENYFEGYLHGHRYEYDINCDGTKILRYSGFYNNGAREGLIRYFDKDGKSMIEQIFKRDLKLSEINHKERIVSFYKFSKSHYDEYDMQYINVKIKYKFYDENGELIKVEKEIKKIYFDGYTKYSENYDYCDYHTEYDDERLAFDKPFNDNLG